MPERAPGHLANEIAELESLLAQKRASLERAGEAGEEKEAFGETFRERYGEAFAPPPAASPGQTTPPPAPPHDQVAAVQTAPEDQQVAALVEIALTKGVRAAAEVARHATPWLLDELHDRLQDRYYDELVRARKLNER
ncbi:hypothetical protein C4552_01685 [Candidatus Parcubacteria bacterium]|nr:MAG: hypothetical protein C4552_01685 [Candidatus Parcubacteria bacterium]